MEQLDFATSSPAYASPLSFVVPVRNDAHGLRRCLESIRAQDGNAEIIVADNGSVDDTRQVGRALGATVLELPGLSISALRNRAAASARGSLLAFVDADMELAPGWLSAAVSAFDRADVVAVGAEYSIPAATTWVQRLYNGMREHRPGVNDARWLASGNMVVRRAAFERLNGFDESLRTCEDWDLCTRLRLDGGRVLSDARLRSVHFGDPATLGGLFRGELWRGGDNLRVSLRSVVSWRDLPSIVFPLLWLVCGAGAILGLSLASLGNWALWVSALCLTTILALAALRTSVILHRAQARHPVNPAAALLFALVYDAARALSLVVEERHRRARPRTSVRTLR